MILSIFTFVISTDKMFILKNEGGKQHLKLRNSTDDVKYICRIAFNNPVVVVNGGKQGGQERGGKWTVENVVRFLITS